MTIPSLDASIGASQRHLYARRPDAEFFATFQQAYAASVPSQ
jgi:hypothetical protein